MRAETITEQPKVEGAAGVQHTSRKGQVTDAIDKIASTTTCTPYRDVLLTKSNSPNGVRTDPKILSDMDRRTRRCNDWVQQKKRTCKSLAYILTSELDFDYKVECYKAGTIHYSSRQ